MLCGCDLVPYGVMSCPCVCVVWIVGVPGVGCVLCGPGWALVATVGQQEGPGRALWWQG